jgi:DNA replication protein DnaC
MFEARISGDSNNEELVLDQSDWMQLSDMRPDVESEIEFSLLKETSNFDWKTTRDKYNESELERGIGWLSKEKEKHKQNNHSAIYTDYDNEVVLPSSLNGEQKQVYKMVEYHHKENQQLLMILIGTAGTGKSYTIKAITHYLGRHLKKAAPTAKAAFIIAGETLHSLLKIPVQKDGVPLQDLSAESLKELQERFKFCKFLIIDEFSMLSQAMLAKINQRLCQIMSQFNSLLFGGISIILAGDPAQLQPVKASKLYDSNPKSNLSMLGKEI